jgi:microcin C transport system substrate-binding protein
MYASIHASGETLMSFSRRTLLRLAGLAPFSKIFAISIAEAQDRQFRHALTLFDDIKYGPDFKHFDYVNPQAPKGGRVRFGVVGSFDSLNPYTYKGDSVGVSSIDALMTSSLDEPSTEYCLVAKEVWHPEDRSVVVYRLRPEARFHDGKQMTPEDVIWSMTTLKESHPQYNSYYKNVVKAEQTGENEVSFVFSQAGNRELPQITGQLPVLPKHWWTGTDAKGKPRNIQETTLEIPLGSGSYKAVDVKPGASFVLKRVEDYWGKDLPLNVGQDNFEEIEYIFFRDANVAFEAFKSDQYDFRSENTAKNWATGYDFPAAKANRVIREKITLKNPKPMQGFAFNLRRAKFQDPRVRRAFNFALDFEWTNTNLFYGEYKRTTSFFQNSELAASGLPDADELAVLETVKDSVPPEVFTAPYMNPSAEKPQDRRKNLREAARLLNESGWKLSQNGGRNLLQNDKGEVFKVEFIVQDPSLERIVLPYKEQLLLLGFDVIVRTIDSAQYERRLQTFDFDIIWVVQPESLSPGNEQREYWGSEAADRNGSRNYYGIKNPAVDKLIDKIIYAETRHELITACKAFDRVLLWNFYVVPLWHAPDERIAIWDRFSRPDKLPDYSYGFPTIWWWDEEKAKKVAQG